MLCVYRCTSVLLDWADPASLAARRIELLLQLLGRTMEVYTMRSAAGWLGQQNRQSLVCYSTYC